MEWKDRIARLFRRKPEWEREHRRTLIARHAENLLRERDISSIAGLKAYFTKAGSGIPRWIKQATALRLYTWVSIRRKDKSAYSHHQ